MIKVACIDHKTGRIDLVFHLTGDAGFYGVGTHGDGSTTFLIRAATEDDLRTIAATLLDEADRREIERRGRDSVGELLDEIASTKPEQDGSIILRGGSDALG